MKLYDSIIIGGGPAGLSGAIYLARFNRSVLVIDSSEGRWQSREINENYLGFPETIPVRNLVLRGRQQAEGFGAEFLEAQVQSISKEDNSFIIITSNNEAYACKTVLFATGVKDNWPTFEHQIDCLGRSLFWCITCDGYKTRNKKMVVVGHTDEAVVSCLQFLEFTKKISFVTNLDENRHDISFEKKQLLDKYAIQFYEGVIAKVESENGYVEKIHLHTGEVIKTEFIFSQLGAKPYSELARSLGVDVNEEKYILTDREQRTNITGVYAAGDVTEQYAHQVVTAAHEGAQAAQAINYDLYSEDQRH